MCWNGSHTMYIENFWGGRGSSKYYHDYIEGGGGVKVLKMYYVVCDWSLIPVSHNYAYWPLHLLFYCPAFATFKPFRLVWAYRMNKSEWILLFTVLIWDLLAVHVSPRSLTILGSSSTTTGSNLMILATSKGNIFDLSQWVSKSSDWYFSVSVIVIILYLSQEIRLLMLE